MQIVGAQNTVDGGAGAARRLSVIGSPETIGPELPGVANVAGCMMRFLYLIQKNGYGVRCCIFICKGQREGISVKLAPLGFEQSGAAIRQCWKGVAHA